MYKKQVNQSHYKFSEYLHKGRWISNWHQLDEVLFLNPSNVLEIGPGRGFFKIMGNHFGLHVETVDIDPDLKPDHVASAQELPFDDNSYDCVCAFQMLEHLPYEQSILAFAEMTRVASKNIVISLPNAKKIWTYQLHIPKYGQKRIYIPRPYLRPIPHFFDGEHYWEINKKGFSLKKILDDFSQYCNLLKTYRVNEFLYHQFFVFEKRKDMKFEIFAK